MSPFRFQLAKATSQPLPSSSGVAKQKLVKQESEHVWTKWLGLNFNIESCPGQSWKGTNGAFRGSAPLWKFLLIRTTYGQRISSVDSGPPSSRCARVLGEMSRFDHQELKLALHVFGYVKPGSSGKEPRRPAFATGLKSGLSWHENPAAKKGRLANLLCWLKISTKD